jgi:hypothetical protein
MTEADLRRDVECGGHIDKRKQADVGCAIRSESPTYSQGATLARWRVDPVSCCRTLFAEERLSPSAREGTPERARQRVARARLMASKAQAAAVPGACFALSGCRIIA